MNTRKQIDAMVVVVLASLIAMGAYTLWDSLRSESVEEEQQEKAADRGARTAVPSAAYRPRRYGDMGGGDYSTSHPAVIIAYTTDNLAHVLYPSGVKVSAWEHDLRKLVKEGWTR